MGVGGYLILGPFRETTVFVLHSHSDRKGYRSIAVPIVGHKLFKVIT